MVKTRVGSMRSIRARNRKAGLLHGFPSSTRVPKRRDNHAVMTLSVPRTSCTHAMALAWQRAAGISWWSGILAGEKCEVLWWNDWM